MPATASQSHRDPSHSGAPLLGPDQTLSAEVSARLAVLLRNEADLAFKRRIPLVFRYLDPQPSDLILDCGSGMGFLLRALARLYPSRLVGLERRAATIKVAQRELAGTRVRLTQGDASVLPFTMDTFDKIAMTEVLEHLPSAGAALAEIWRVLRPGGVLALTVPNADYPFLWDPLNKTLERLLHIHVPSDIWWLAGIWADHVRLYSPQTLRAELEGANFIVEELTPYTHYCLPFHHFLVYGLGKNLIQRGLLPGPLAQAADRFRGEENTGSLLNPMNVAHRLLEWVDRGNEGLRDPSLSYVGIAARARKPA